MKKSDEEKQEAEEQYEDSPASSVSSPLVLKNARMGQFPVWALLNAYETHKLVENILLWIVRVAMNPSKVKGWCRLLGNTPRPRRL